jgi:NAD(P)-dependent dehydrogenase (short-subunit alcohol dehydrogenase family)
MIHVPLRLLDTASKGAVLAMTRELAMVHAREGIRLNALCPSVLAHLAKALYTQLIISSSFPAAGPCTLVNASADIVFDSGF